MAMNVLKITQNFKSVHVKTLVEHNVVFSCTLFDLFIPFRLTLKKYYSNVSVPCVKLQGASLGRYHT